MSGEEYVEEAAEYQPDLAAEVAVDVVLSPSSNAPVFREIKENYLMDFLKSQYIDLETYLDNSTMNWNPSLVKSIKAQKQQLMAQMGQGQPMNDQAQQEVMNILPTS